MKFHRLWLTALLLLTFAPASALAERQWIASGPTPTRYEIAITPDVEAATFVGEARIAVTAAAPANSVTLNAMDLTVSHASVDGARATVTSDAAAQTITLTPRRPLSAGSHSIEIAYAGKIQDDAYGLFRVSYEADGQTRHALATQFEPMDARRVAPMWDQPDRRAVFSLTLTAPSDQFVVSNMPIARAEAAGRGLTRTTFADTPSMASYLLFFAIGDFERVTRMVDGVELGVVVRRGAGVRAQYALDVGEQSLRYFRDYFGIPYPLPKLDMIGVPGAASFGAMENWGAILYFDQYLLTDAHTSEAERQDVFNIIAHEIAHQWFGNLATMEWWDDLWLNEGFASWMASKATEHQHPDWQPWLGVRAGSAEQAMALDSRAGTHPIVQTVENADQANLAFDDITYDKGQAFIRMLEGYVGEDDFRTGVRAYIGANLYGNARTEELWAALQQASGQPVLDIARSFTQQEGFPVLSTAAAACPEGRGRCIALTQRRFAMDDASRTGERWSIPVVARRIGQAPARLVMPAQADHVIALPGRGAYLINAGQSGFFRVRYDAANLAQLRRAFPTLDAADQLGMLSDYWAFGRSGDAPYSDYLDLVDTLPANANPLVAIDTAQSMLALASYAKGRPSEAGVKAYGRRVLQPLFARVGWAPRAGEPANDTLLRATLIEALSALDDADTIAEVRRLVRGAEPLPDSIRGAVLAAYAESADPAAFNDVVARARAATDFVEQRRFWLWLASVDDAALAARALQLTEGEDIPRQLRPQVIAVVAASHPRLGWDYFTAHRERIEAQLDPMQRLEYPAAVASPAADPAIAAALEAYASAFPEDSQRALRSAAASIRARAQTISERFPAAEAWIAAHQR